MLIAFGVILLVLCIGAMVSAVAHGSLSSERPGPDLKLVESPKLDEQNLYDIRVETVIVPPEKPGYDWKASIQSQLDAIEHDDPTVDLVSAVTVGGRIVLFYRRRIK